MPRTLPRSVRITFFAAACVLWSCFIGCLVGWALPVGEDLEWVLASMGLAILAAGSWAVLYITARIEEALARSAAAADEMRMATLEAVQARQMLTIGFCDRLLDLLTEPEPETDKGATGPLRAVS